MGCGQDETQGPGCPWHGDWTGPTAWLPLKDCLPKDGRTRLGAAADTRNKPFCPCKWGMKVAELLNDSGSARRTHPKYHKPCRGAGLSCIRAVRRFFSEPTDPGSDAQKRTGRAERAQAKCELLRKGAGNPARRDPAKLLSGGAMRNHP